MVQEKKSKRLSRKLQKSYVIKTDIDELSDVLCELLKLLNIEELHIMTYKDRIDVFATKEMTPLHVELYERFFSLHPDDAEQEEFIKNQKKIEITFNEKVYFIKYTFFVLTFK